MSFISKPIIRSLVITALMLFRALNLMAILNPNITHTAIDGGMFQNEIQERNIMGVPAVFLNGNEFGQGRMTLAEIVSKVDSNAEKRTAELLNKKMPLMF